MGTSQQLTLQNASIELLKTIKNISIKKHEEYFVCDKSYQFNAYKLW